MMANNAIVGSSLDVIQINARGNLIILHNKNMNGIFKLSKRLSDYLKEKCSYALYLDMNPDNFHCLLDYFKLKDDVSRKPNQILTRTLEDFEKKISTDPSLMWSLAYLEISQDLIEYLDNKKFNTT